MGALSHETHAPPWTTEKQASQMINAESHTAKTGRMEAAASQGYGGGIPSKIEEGVEPGEIGGGHWR